MLYLLRCLALSLFPPGSTSNGALQSTPEVVNRRQLLNGALFRFAGLHVQGLSNHPIGERVK